MFQYTGIETNRTTKVLATLHVAGFVLSFKHFVVTNKQIF